MSIDARELPMLNSVLKSCTSHRTPTAQSKDLLQSAPLGALHFLTEERHGTTHLVEVLILIVATGRFSSRARPRLTWTD
jgi:hypothetical protein